MSQIALATAARYGPKLSENLAENMAVRSKSFDLAGLKSCFKGHPIIICGAGPTLNSAIPRIQKIQNKCQIVAVDMAGPCLTKAGIRVDVLCTLDVIDAKADAIHASKARLLVPSTLAANALIEAFDGPVAFAGTRVDSELGHEPFIGDFENVAHLALAVAEFTGAGDIYLCGVDFCVTEDFTVYADNAIVSELQTKKYSETPEGFIEVMCNDGRNRATWPSTPAYIQSLERQISIRAGDTFQSGFEAVKIVGADHKRPPAELTTDRQPVPKLADIRAIDVDEIMMQAVSGLRLCHGFANAVDQDRPLPVEQRESQLLTCLRRLQPQIEREVNNLRKAGDIKLATALPYAGLIPLLNAFISGLRK
ncbi:MAG: 6-hydroxymethylpterin diphosphokinase MptE-like protein [Planctomycetota bacterium]